MLHAWGAQPAIATDQASTGPDYPGAMGLLYELVVEMADATSTVQIEANSKEEALESGQ